MIYLAKQININNHVKFRIVENMRARNISSRSRSDDDDDSYSGSQLQEVNIFDEAQQSIYSLMELDSFRRFKLSLKRTDKARCTAAASIKIMFSG